MKISLSDFKIVLPFVLALGAIGNYLNIWGKEPHLKDALKEINTDRVIAQGYRENKDYITALNFLYEAKYLAEREKGNLNGIWLGSSVWYIPNFSPWADSLDNLIIKIEAKVDTIKEEQNKLR